MPSSRSLLFLILAFCHFSAFAQNDLTLADYDKLVARYRYYKPDSAIYFAHQGIALAKKLKDANGVAMMYNQLGIIDDNRGKYEESRKKYLIAKGLYERTGNRKGVATEIVRLGVVEMRKGNYDKSIGYFLQALKISEEIDDKPGQMEAYITLGEAYQRQKKYKVALKYFRIAEKLDRSLPPSSLSLNLLNDLGSLYRDLGKFDRAITYFKNGISRAGSPQFQGHFITLTNNLATVYAKQGKTTLSIKLLENALVKSREIKNYIRELQTLSALASAYSISNPEKALFYLDNAYKLAKSNNAHKSEIETLEEISKLYKTQGRYAEALKAKETEYALADSFYFEEMSKQISSLQAERELSKSNAEIEKLKYANGQQEIKSNINLAVTAGVVVILLFVAFYYYRTRQLNNLLNKTNSKLEEANLIKDKLFSVLAHDLRSPLASIINLLVLINDDEFNELEKKAMLEKLSNLCNASLETLDALLKWGEMQLKGVRLSPTEFNPKELIVRNIALLAQNAEIKAINIRYLVASNIRITADPDHFEFVVRNLLSNAIKFTPDNGVVEISAQPVKGANRIEFTVSDTGVGIPEEKLKEVFDISNISTVGTNNEKGTSIGLAICKEFIEANGGEIRVTSEQGKGSSFSFALTGSLV